ncbi:MAG: ComEC/Rec2 family competence protein [Alphaproteobacteria bacterium]
MNGQRAGIADDDAEALRHAGLAHLLAISGLHIGLVCGTVFFFARFGMAFFAGFALRHPIKKYAAIAALAAGVFYMLIAGATVPTQRAMIMAGIVFTAIILDRSPLSLRLVALAALVVLVIAPYSLLTASFQLSFAAVAGLVAFYDALRPFLKRIAYDSGIIKRVLLYFFGVSLTSIVAGLATAPFALYHFQELATYNILANLAAIPIMAFWVMPLVVLSYVLMPLGLEALCLQGAALGVERVLWVAHSVAGLDYAVLRLPAISFAAFLLMSAGLIALVLLRGHMRVMICIMAFVVSSIFLIPKQSDILISSTSRLIGVHDKADHLRVNTLRRERFVSENWARALGLQKADIKLWSRLHPTECDDKGCHMSLKGKRIAYSQSPESHALDCALADIVIAEQPVFIRCKALKIDKFDTHFRGAHSVFIDGQGGVQIAHTRSAASEKFPWGMGVFRAGR